MVTRIASRLTHRDVPKCWESTVRVGKSGRLIAASSVQMGQLCACTRHYVVKVNSAPPQVQTVVTYIGRLEHCVLHDFARDCQVPLVALGWPEVLGNCVADTRA